MSFREMVSKMPLEVRRKLFVGEDISKAYRKYRLSCDRELIEEIISYTREKLPGKLTRALDVGCGTGQCTRAIAPYFDEVIGIDISPTQLQEAVNDPANQTLSNISFKIGLAEELPFEDSSVQLVTAASSFHWFNRDDFIKEVKRVLVPNGVLAVCSAGRENLVSYDPEIQDKLLKAKKEFRASRFVGQDTEIPSVNKKIPEAETVLTEFKDNKQITKTVKGSNKLIDVMERIKSTSRYHEAFGSDKERGQAALDELTKKYLTILQSTESAEDCLINVERVTWYAIGRA